MQTVQCKGLPPQRAKVLELAVMGMTEKKTAKAMGISPRTVKAHRTALFFHLDAQNIGQAIGEAFRRGHLEFLAILLCVSFVSPYSTSTDSDDEPVIRRIRTRSGGRRLTKQIDLSDPHSLIWDDGEFIVQRTQEAL